MAHAADRLYNEVIRREMGVLATKVKVRDIVAYLPCLTITDREEIEAKREIAGNYSAMMALLDNLRRRENWPEQFITALHHIEQPQLANLISDGYNRIRGIHTSTPAPVPVPAPPAAAPPTPAPTSAEPLATVATHAAPYAPSIPAPSPTEPLATVTTPTAKNIPCSTLPMQTPSVQIPTQSSISSPMNFAPSSHPNKVAPDSAEGHAGVSAQDAPVHTPPKATQPIKHVIVTGARSPSPVSAPTFTPSVGQNEVLVDARETPKLSISDSLTHAALPGPSTLGPTVPTNPTSYKVNKPVNTSKSSALPQKIPVAASISVKHPVQDTNPPRTGLQNNTTINQVGERVHTREPSLRTAQALPSTYSGAVAGNIATEYEENFSKPGVLLDEEPLSNISDPSLQISNMTADSSPIRSAMINRSEEPVNGHVSVNHNLLSSSSTTVSDHVGAVQNSTPHAFENSFQEGGNSSYSLQPVEDVYESLQTSRHVIQFSENPSLPNLDGQPLSVVGPTIDLSYRSAAESPVQSVSEARSIQKFSESMQRNNTNAQTSLATCFTAPDPFRQSELNTLNQVDIPQSEPREESQGVLHQVQSNSHLIAAAAIGMAAVFMALKFKH